MTRQQGPSAAVRYARETVDLAIEGADADGRDDLVERLRGARDLLSGSVLRGSAGALSRTQPRGELAQRERARSPAVGRHLDPGGVRLHFVSSVATVQCDA
ncbi:hypothetical protein LWC33_15100 [Pseudonocardia sp. RS11V-5]|uniref:hypothetical protein n=1 Tax=Pseudonocardia terrae TaxID=2905831 RepID=UPI001E3E0CC8|nr:hypothetical protein [Pseudonocardia terrae]MCE3552779.1 hypothetical protein [Pseudonocardia terrae]